MEERERDHSCTVLISGSPHSLLKEKKTPSEPLSIFYYYPKNPRTQTEIYFYNLISKRLVVYFTLYRPTLSLSSFLTTRLHP